MKHANPHPYNRRPQLEGKGHLPIGMNYAMGTGGPSGSELPPPLGVHRCYQCGGAPRRVGGNIRMRIVGGKLWCGCMSTERISELMSDWSKPLRKHEIAAGWHFCDEWDGLLIGPGMVELEACQCSGASIARERQAVIESPREEASCLSPF